MACSVVVSRVVYAIRPLNFTSNFVDTYQYYLGTGFFLKVLIWGRWCSTTKMSTKSRQLGPRSPGGMGYVGVSDPDLAPLLHMCGLR